MSLTSHPNIPLWIQNRIVGFFNHARSIDMILNGQIQDDPSDGAGSTIGRTIAARILRVRNARPNRRFTDFEQIDAIRGVGPNTVQDLVYSFGQSADEAFKTAMYNSGTIYQNNWPLEYFRFEFTDETSFTTLAQDAGQLRQFIITKLTEVSLERQVNTADTQLMQTELANAYMDHYTNNTPEAAYAFALWFYKFDADNWFSWEDIQQQTIGYFDYNMNSYPWMMDLYFFKGFTNRGIINPGISAKDLPVVVNWAEQTVSFWISELYD